MGLLASHRHPATHTSVCSVFQRFSKGAIDCSSCMVLAGCQTLLEQQRELTEADGFRRTMRARSSANCVLLCGAAAAASADS